MFDLDKLVPKLVESILRVIHEEFLDMFLEWEKDIATRSRIENLSYWYVMETFIPHLSIIRSVEPAARRFVVSMAGLIALVQARVDMVVEDQTEEEQFHAERISKIMIKEYIGKIRAWWDASELKTIIGPNHPFQQGIDNLESFFV